MLDVVLDADLLEPVGAAASGRHNYVGAEEFVLAAVGVDRADAGADFVFDDEVGAVHAEEYFDAVRDEIFLYRVVDMLRFLSAEVADGTVDESETSLYRALAYLFDERVVRDALDVLVRAELEIDGVSVVYEILRSLPADKLRELAADLI